MKFLNVELLTVDVRVAIMKLRYKFADAENLMQQWVASAIVIQQSINKLTRPVNVIFDYLPK